MEDLKLRLKDLRKNGLSNSPEKNLLQNALRIENYVTKNGSSDVSNYFTIGYAGRRVISWRFTDGFWEGQLANLESGIVKKESSGHSAEEMLRGLMPVGRLKQDPLQ